MFERVTVYASDLEASALFYSTVLAVLGLRANGAPPVWDHFALAPATGERPVTRRLHIGFAAPSRELVDAFWRTGVDAGYRDDGEPGLRPEYGPDYYGGFLLDPDGNSAEAVHHDETTHGRRTIDHLWIRVTDVAAARAFYAGLAPRAGMRIGSDTPERVQVRDDTGSFSLVAGTPTEHAALTLRAAEPGDAAELRDPDGNRIELVA